MKYIRYSTIGYMEEYDSEADTVKQKECLIGVCCEYNETNEEIAKQKSYNGEYTIEDDGVEENSEPTQLDRIESQIAYLALITGNKDILTI